MNWEEMLNKLLGWAVDFAVKLLAAALVMIIGRLLIKWIMKRIGKSRFAKKNDATVVRVMNNFISAGLHVILIVSVIGILGVPMASVIAIVASAGVAIGLALQGALSNLAGGIMIMILRPLHIGDFVEVAGTTGTVKDVGIFYTVIHTGDNKAVTIPNGSIMASSVINYSTNATRRVDLVFNVAYGTDVERVKAILLEEADKHELVMKDPAPFARLTKQSESSLDFTLRVWTESANYWQVNFDLLETLNNRFVAEGIEIPFNQLDVHITK